MPLRLDFDASLALNCAHEAQSRWTLRSDGLSWNVPLKGERGAAWLGSVAGGALGSEGALAFHVEPSEPDPHAMDKIMLELFGLHAPREDFVDFGVEWFVGFQLLLPHDFEAPVAGTRMLVWQLWQGTPYPPPLRIEIDHERRAVLYLMNDRTGAHECAGTPGCLTSPAYEGVRTLYRSEPLPVEEWVPFAIRLVPRYEGYDGDRAGEIDLWLHDMRREAPVHRSEAFVGYDPRGFGRYPRAEQLARHPADVLDSSLGIYRSRQMRSQTILFDRVRAGTSFAAVTAP